MNKKELEQYKKQVSENEDSAIKLINKVKYYEDLIEKLETFLTDLSNDEDLIVSLTAIGIHKKLISLKMENILKGCKK